MALFNSFKEKLVKGNYNLGNDLNQTNGLGNTYFEFCESKPDLYGNSTRGDVSSLLIKDGDSGVTAPPKLFKSLEDEANENPIQNSDITITSSNSQLASYVRLNTDKQFRLVYSSSYNFNGRTAIGVVLLRDVDDNAAARNPGDSLSPASNDALVAYFPLTSSFSANGVTRIFLPVPSDILELI